jgi:hypothetical protein
MILAITCQEIGTSMSLTASMTDAIEKTSKNDLLPPSRLYFEQIEDHRYQHVPEIFSLVQSTLFNNQDVLEVDVGAGSDYLQWVRAGHASGVNLTESGVATTQQRLDAYGLSATTPAVADAERLPFAADCLDLAVNLALIPRLGETGAALASSVSCWAATVVLLVCFGRLTGLSEKEYLRPRISDYRTPYRALVQTLSRSAQ